VGQPGRSLANGRGGIEIKIKGLALQVTLEPLSARDYGGITVDHDQDYVGQVYRDYGLRGYGDSLLNP
jgi:hypothetical protein